MSNPKGKNPQAGKNRAANQEAARENARILREERLQREKRTRLLIRVGAPVLVVILIVVAFVVIKANQKSPAPAPAAAPAAAGLTTELQSVPAATYDTVGLGTTLKPSALTAISGDPLTADGKPRVLYIGAEYCPFCAAERWSMITALARFGTFTGLGTTSSSSTDYAPSTPTMSFHGATYTSQYLSFTGVEETTNVPDGNGGYTVLDTPTAADQALLVKYDTKQTIPFVSLGNKYMVNGASYSPLDLAGLTQAQVAADLKDPSSVVAKDVLGGANLVTAALCKLTNNQPTAVCTSSAVTSQKLPS